MDRCVCGRGPRHVEAQRNGTWSIGGTAIVPEQLVQEENGELYHVCALLNLVLIYLL